MIRTQLSADLGIETPIFAFTYQPEVAAAVTRAGGLGVLGAVRFSADELAEALDYLDKETDGKPYGVDVVMPMNAPTEGTAVDLTSLIPDEHREFVTRMIAHHQDALSVAQTEVAGGANPQAKQLAQQILDGQTAEISRMQALLPTL